MTPEELFRQRIAEAVCKYIDDAELDDVMNDNAVESLKSDLTFIITQEVKYPSP